MRGAETADDEFEVGFNPSFDSHWYRAEQLGRVVLVISLVCAALRLQGRGPVVVFENGTFNWRRMTRLRLTKQDVTAEARQRGLMRPGQVRYAVADRYGKISIVQDEA